MKMTSKSEQQTSDIAQHILDQLQVNTKGATILALRGDLGSGKTTFTKKLASHLGVSETIVSPTFVIAKFYALPEDSPWKQMIHMDAYRLESDEELRKLGFHDEFSNPDNLMVVEWPGNIAGELLDGAQYIQFTFLDEGVREIELK